MSHQLAIDQLPELCMRRIFRYLGVRDLTRCRAVCHLFKYYVDLIGLSELIVDKLKSSESEDYWNPTNYWYLTDRPIQCEDSIRWEVFASLRPSQFRLNEQLKFLCIHQLISFSDLDFQLLNGFEQLMHLEVQWLEFVRTQTDRKELILHNLRVLSLRHLIYSDLFLDTPRLEVLRCDQIGSVELEHPESIRKLESNYAGAIVMAKFENLELFKCEFIDSPGLDRDLLSSWNRLKELDFDLDFANDYEREENEAFRLSLLQILDRRARSKSREKLKIYLNDVQLLDADQLEDQDLMEDWPYFQIKNFKLLRDDSRLKVYVDFVDYGQVMRLTEQLCSDFFDKFPAIRAVDAIGAVDPDRFEWFLKNVNRLEELFLTETALGQTFLNKLPSINDRLTHLAIGDSTNCVTNFDFIWQLKRLRNFETNQQFEAPLDWAEEAFRRLADFCLFEFRSDTNERVAIQRDLTSEDSFRLMFNQDPTDPHNDDEIIDENRDDRGNEETIFARYNESWELVSFCRNKLKWVKLRALCDQRKNGEPLLLFEFKL